MDRLANLAKTMRPNIQQKSATSSNYGLEVLDFDLVPSVSLLIFWIMLCFFTSIIVNNYSQVDKLWSITPPIYVLIYAIQAGFHPKLTTMLVLATLWGIRLTYNFSRRGGYTWPLWAGEEDYRWEIVRNHKFMQAARNPFRWQVFNLVFICFYQHFILFMIASPGYVVLKQLQNQRARHDGTLGMSAKDMFLAVMFVATLITETIADQQQYNFQNEKHRKINFNKKCTNEKEKIPFTDMEQEGFISNGLFSLCRHPNYACEQLLWILFYGFSVGNKGVAASGLNFSGLGCLLLVLLFTPSAMLSEGISMKKYKRYGKYVNSKFMFLPFGGEYAAGQKAD